MDSVMLWTSHDCMDLLLSLDTWGEIPWWLNSTCVPFLMKALMNRHIKKKKKKRMAIPTTHESHFLLLFHISCKFKLGMALTRQHSRRKAARLWFVYSFFVEFTAWTVHRDPTDIIRSCFALSNMYYVVPISTASWDSQGCECLMVWHEVHGGTICRYVI